MYYDINNEFLNTYEVNSSHLESLGITNLSVPNFVLMSAYFSTYISLENFSYTNIYSIKNIRNVIVDLNVKKLLMPIALKDRDSHTEKCYCLTKDGYAKIVFILSNEHMIKYKVRRAGITTLHDFSAGQNFFPILSCAKGRELRWSNEVVYGDYKRTNKTLCVDSSFYFNRKNFSIEQDMGTESDLILLRKIEKYRRFDIFNNDNPLIISYKVPNIVLSSDIYSQNKIKELIKECEETGARAFQNNDTAALLSQKIKRELNVDELHDYLTDLVFQKNKIYEIEYNFIQYRSFRKKRDNLIYYLSSLSEYDNALLEFKYCTPLYFVPTAMLGRYVRFILDFNGFFGKTISTFLSYYKDGGESYKEFDKIGSFHFRNIYETKLNYYVFELFSVDLSSYFRLKEYSKERTTKPLKVFCIIDKLSDAPVIGNKSVIYLLLSDFINNIFHPYSL